MSRAGLFCGREQRASEPLGTFISKSAAMVFQLLPDSLYSVDSRSPALLSSSSVSISRSERNAVPTVFSASESTMAQKFRAGASPSGMPLIPAASEKKIQLYSRDFYAACTLGGVLSCGLTHTAVTPLDVVKCNMQIDPTKYKSIGSGFSITVKESGFAGLVRGWFPTLIGYSVQGAGKFGLYEYFKKTYADAVGPENAAKYQTLVFLAGSASAEFFADIGLCPFEAVKVKVQTVPGYANGLSDGLPKFVQQEGVAGLWKGITPLWGRQIPYTMMKFACFENTVQALYKYVVPKPKAECTKTEQLGVSFAAGYIAGVFCAVVSHPADNLVSKLNSTKGATMGSIISEMGWVALFTRGLPLRIVMIGTLTGLQWGIYDAFKVYVGLPTTGSAPPPEPLAK
ncbi:phosphate carrier protein, mitochondrial [Coccomyxa sp. Obi]|nr:phosphate carrier protein, mitochondrial [Coccomyxa sp. Obi]